MNEPQIISHVTKGDKRDLIFQAKDLVGYSSWGRKRVGRNLATEQQQPCLFHHNTSGHPYFPQAVSLPKYQMLPVITSGQKRKKRKGEYIPGLSPILNFSTQSWINIVLSHHFYVSYVFNGSYLPKPLSMTFVVAFIVQLPSCA